MTDNEPPTAPRETIAPGMLRTPVEKMTTGTHLLSGANTIEAILIVRGITLEEDECSPDPSHSTKIYSFRCLLKYFLFYAFVFIGVNVNRFDHTDVAVIFTGDGGSFSRHCVVLRLRI
jgi:hypothetical protein